MAANFDYIIIGGGSAGCVLANRLSEDAKHQVCLIEAGPPDTSPFIRIPMGLLVVIRSKILNWKFWTEKQPNCANRSIYWPRGRTLGGSSAINAMCYVRGNSRDYDEWAKLGNKGWAYHDVLPYFKKSENFEHGANYYHGSGGPLNVASHRYINPLVKAFVAAGKEAGYPFIDDFNSNCQEGIGYFDVMQKGGERCSNAHAYLREAKNRPNLTIITNAYVTKILFEKKRAIGIRYNQKGRTNEIFSRKEIILSAGTIGSPQLLLLSGIGPRAEIEKHGIELIHDLPGVGENLQDHLDIHITCLEKTRYAISFRLVSLLRHIRGFFKYIFYHTGELTCNYAQGCGFLKSDPKQPIPNLQWHFCPSVFTNSALFLRPLLKYYGYTLLTCGLHPISRGRITLKSADPLVPPLINPNYLAHEDDLTTLAIGIKKSRQVLAQAAFKPSYLCELEPGEKIQTDEEIRDYIRHRAETIYHPVGTCKMGIDIMAVVDPQLKVHGLQQLRVIDASIMPVIITGNTNAATTMIAEKGADMILQKA